MGETDDFEWDDDKDAVNRNERDLPLLAAAVLFDGRPRLERASRKFETESRLRLWPNTRASCYSAFGYGKASAAELSRCRWHIGASAVSSSKQHKQVKEAIDSVDWAALAQLSDGEIARRWRGDAEASWPDAKELTEFRRGDLDAPKKPPQAAE